MSMDASGAFGGALVFGRWKGRNTVRQLVSPSNPQSSLQEQARNRARVAAVGQHFANATTLKRAGETLTDKQELISATPAGQAWNGYLVKSMIGAGAVQYAAAETAYNALTAGQKTGYDTAAAALVPAIPAVAQTTTGGAASTPMAAGKAYFLYLHGLYVAGVTTAPGTTPPTYA
jgi:hypothetical protein